MITRYNNSHKTYRLVDVNNNHLSFNRYIIVDKQVGPFQASPEFKITTEQPIMAKDSSGKLQVAPPKRGEILSRRSLPSRKFLMHTT
jgi:hypothetical protein